MSNLLKQITTFSTFQYISTNFRWIFILLNFLPFGLSYMDEIEPRYVFGFFIIETIVYCMINYFNTWSRLILPIIAILLICLSIYSFIYPSFSNDKSIAYLNYLTIITVFYAIQILKMKDKFYDIEEATF